MNKVEEMNKLAEIRNIIGNKFPSWPEGINFSYKNNTLTLILTKEAVGVKEYIDKKNNETKYKGINMQDNSACFEGWAIGLKAWDKNKKIDKIYLDVDGKLPEFDEKFREKDKKIKLSGHYGRFLYRALRFSEQYEWFFKLDDGLKSVVQDFKDKILKKGNVINNMPEEDEAGTNDKLECRVETKMAGNKKAFLGCLQNADCHVEKDQEVYRQLPVGLFLKEVKEGNQVFTGGASAIDLWTLKGDTLQVVELKADNKMVGIITEIFFYSNYMYDLLFDDGVFKLNKPIAEIEQNRKRGYACLIRNKIEKIQGIMLADVYHPVLDVLNAGSKKDKIQMLADEYHSVLDVLNAGSKKDKIQYFRAEYDFDITIKQK